MQVPLLSGVGADETAEFAVRYPLNLEPVAIDNKIAKGQLRAAAGAVPFAMGSGPDRGGIVWNGQHYRVMGTKFVRVNADATVTEIGDVGGTGRVALDYSFDRLGIQSGAALYYFNGSTLSQVTDPDLGPAIDMIWLKSHFLTTDGSSIIATELADSTSVQPLKYGSAEEDPDMVTGLLKFREEAYIFGRHTIQVQQYVGGNGYPLAAVPGASIPIGCVGPAAKTLFAGSFAFVGSARNEALGVYLAGDGSASKISTRAIDDALAAVSDFSAISLEKRVSRDEQRLFVHLPTESWVFLAGATQKVEQAVWYRARSGRGGAYRLRNAVDVGGRVMVGDSESGAIGVLSEGVSTHFGEPVEWQVDAGLIYNGGKGGLVHAIELVGLPGRGGEQMTVFLSLTRDGQQFSAERPVTVRSGERSKRLHWRPHQRFRSWMGLRFRGYDAGLPGFAAIEADVRPLAA